MALFKLQKVKTHEENCLVSQPAIRDDTKSVDFINTVIMLML